MCFNPSTPPLRPRSKFQNIVVKDIYCLYMRSEQFMFPKSYQYKSMGKGQAVVSCAFNASTWEAEAGWCQWVGVQPGLQNKFQDSQRYTKKPCLKKQTNTTNRMACPEIQGVFVGFTVLIHSTFKEQKRILSALKADSDYCVAFSLSCRSTYKYTQLMSTLKNAQGQSLE